MNIIKAYLRKHAEKSKYVYIENSADGADVRVEFDTKEEAASFFKKKIDEYIEKVFTSIEEFEKSHGVVYKDVIDGLYFKNEDGEARVIKE